jgi:hypothetical protein
MIPTNLSLLVNNNLQKAAGTQKCRETIATLV